MPVENHDLIHELPEYKERIRELKMTGGRCAARFEVYQETDHAVLRVEEGIENTSDEYLEALNDELFAMIKAEA